MPEADVPVDDLNLAEAGGTGSHAWPGFGFDGSNGGALRMFLGMALTGCELMTSVYFTLAISKISLYIHIRLKFKVTYPARIGVQKAPPHAILANVLHPPTTVQEDSEHAFAELYYALVLLSFCRLGSVVSHGVLLRDGRDNEGGMQVNERLTQRRELGVSTAHFEVLQAMGQLLSGGGENVVQKAWFILLSGWCRLCNCLRSPSSCPRR